MSQKMMFQVYLDWADCQSGQNTIVAKAVSQEQFESDVKAVVAKEEEKFMGRSGSPDRISELLISEFGYERVPVIGYNLKKDEDEEYL